MGRMSAERRQQERSVATRRALLDAALDCLTSLGYTKTTTLEVSRRAGVSRGAQLHHFRSRVDLLTAAVDHLLERRVAEFRAQFSEFNAATEAEPTDRAIDLLWTMFQGPAFIAWVELWVAARTDPQLAAAVAAMDRRFEDETRAVVDDLLADVIPSAAERDLRRDFTFAVLDGVALLALVPRGQRPASDHIAVLKAVARSGILSPEVR